MVSIRRFEVLFLSWPVAALAIVLTGCGYTARDGELVGQAKKLVLRTPIICPDYYSLDISLGVMRNGTGSMSTQDVWITVYDVRDLPRMKEAVEQASVVRVTYDVRRVAICTDDYISTAFEVVP